MFKGFYNLTSAMMTQGRNLNVIANNMTNISTAGYKTQQYTASTFKDALISHMYKNDVNEIGTESYILASDELYTNYTQGAVEETGLTLDFAINGDGFFGIETDDGPAYTRTGSFCLDDEGYLYLTGQGRVLGSGGNPIQLSTDNINVDTSGNIYNSAGARLGQLGVYTFDDNGQLQYNDKGLLISDTQPEQSQDAVIQCKSLETSNVDMVKEMTNMMSAERAYQSAAQVTKIYDEIMDKITTQVGRV